MNHRSKRKKRTLRVAENGRVLKGSEKIRRKTAEEQSWSEKHGGKTGIRVEGW